MAGHSKWANIKHRKGRRDAEKGKVFTRASKELINAVKLGGPDPRSNTRLRLAIQKAKAVNMPTDNIDRCIKRASHQDQAAYEEMTYEIYGHGGVGIIVEVMTDNKNRASSDLRVVLNRRGGTLAHPGAVAFNFDKKGVIHVAKKSAFEDELFLAVSEAGAEDFSVEEEAFLIICDPEKLDAIKEAISAHGFACESSEVEMLPKNLVECAEGVASTNQILLQALEEVDDVESVWHNMRL